MKVQAIAEFWDAERPDTLHKVGEVIDVDAKRAAWLFNAGLAVDYVETAEPKAAPKRATARKRAAAKKAE